MTERLFDLSKGEADIAIRGGASRDAAPTSVVERARVTRMGPMDYCSLCRPEPIRIGRSPLTRWSNNAVMRERSQCVKDRSGSRAQAPGRVRRPLLLAIGQRYRQRRDTRKLFSPPPSCVQPAGSDYCAGSRPCFLKLCPTANVVRNSMSALPAFGSLASL